MRAADRLRSESGITIIELMVASFMLVVGILAIFAVMTSSRDLTSQAETLEAASHIAEREVEALQSLGWAALAHPSMPASGPAPHTVTAGSLQTPAGVAEPVVVTPASGVVPAAATAWTDGRLRGRMWRFVSWRDDPADAAAQDYKRLTVVVEVDGPKSIDVPVVISTYAAQKEGV
jgi:Tfp pilus assembly protein PilV